MGIETDLLKGALVVSAAALAAWGVWELLGYICELTRAKIRQWLTSKHGRALLEAVHEKLNRQGSLLNKGFRFVLELLPGSKRARAMIYGPRKDGRMVKMGECVAKVRDEAAENLAHGKYEDDIPVGEMKKMLSSLASS